MHPVEARTDEATDPSLPTTDPDDRSEPSRTARIACSVLVALVCTGNLLLHVPDFTGGGELRPLGSSLLNAMGVEMTWIVFAPNPPGHTIDLTATITYVDGSSSTWRVPRTEPWIGTYHQYRWGKLAEFTILGGEAYAWAGPQLAAGIADRSERDRGVEVTRVDLIARRKPILGLGEPVWTDVVLVRHEPQRTP